jgi:hypothetical protein
MRFGLLGLLLLVVGCPGTKEGDPCKGEGQLACGTNQAQVLICQSGKYAEAGLCPNAGSCYSDPTATKSESVNCGSRLPQNSFSVANVHCENSIETACSVKPAEGALVCTNNVWLSRPCTSSQVCANTATGVECRDVGGSGSSGSTSGSTTGSTTTGGSGTNGTNGTSATTGTTANPGSASLSGELAFPVAEANSTPGHSLPDGGADRRNVELNLDEQANSGCGSLRDGRILFIKLSGPSGSNLAVGTYPLPVLSGVANLESYSSGFSTHVASGSSGTLTLTEIDDAQMAGSFSITMQYPDAGSSDLSGTFTAPACQ